MDYRDVAEKLRRKAADKAVGPEEREALLAKAKELEGKIGPPPKTVTITYVERNTWVTRTMPVDAFPSDWYITMDDWWDSSDWYSGAELLGEKMLNRIILITAFVLTTLGIGLTMANANTSQPGTNSANYCVKFGSGAGAAGNVVLNNWDNSPCPAGTYSHTLRVVDSDPFLPPGFTLDSSSINPTRAESGIAFTITDFATTPTTIWNCMYTAPKVDNSAPGIVCTKH